MKVLSFDLKQAEPRFLCAFTRDEGLLEALFDKEGRDFYKLLALKLWGRVYEEITKEDREKIKAVVLAAPYSLFDPKTTAMQLNISDAAARDIIEKYCYSFPAVVDWVKAEIERVTLHGYQETIFGRRVQFPGLSYKTRHDLLEEQRRVINNKHQNSVSSLLKWMMVKIEKTGLAEIKVPVFDALYLTPRNGVDPLEVAKTLKKEIEFTYEGIPFATDWYIGDSWEPKESLEV